MTLCDRLRAARLDADLEQKDLARLLGITQQQYSLYETAGPADAGGVVQGWAPFQGPQGPRLHATRPAGPLASPGPPGRKKREADNRLSFCIP